MFANNDSKSARKGLRTLTGYTKKAVKCEPANVNEYSDDINKFFARFDQYDFSGECENILTSIPEAECGQIAINESDVIDLFDKVTVNKASGPDNLCGTFLKACEHKVAGVFTKLYSASMVHWCRLYSGTVENSGNYSSGKENYPQSHE